MRSVHPLTFFPDWERLGEVDPNNKALIREEPMLFGADRRYAEINGGPLTSMFLRQCPSRSDLIIDSKVTMLMAGMWPCIPGWHHDDVDRPTPDAQPDYDNRKTSPMHWMMHLGDTYADPEFVTEPVSVPRLPGRVKVYKAWDRYIDALDPAREAVRSGQVVRFSWEAFHRGMPATQNGWRFWIRASLGSSRTVTNEVRKQVQVYLSDPSEGW